MLDKPNTSLAIDTSQEERNKQTTQELTSFIDFQHKEPSSVFLQAALRRSFKVIVLDESSINDRLDVI